MPAPTYMADRRHTKATGKRQAVHKANQHGAEGLINAKTSGDPHTPEQSQTGTSTLKNRASTSSRHNDR